MIRTVARVGGYAGLAMVIVVAAALSGAGTVQAGEIADAAGRAETLAADGKGSEALAAFDAAQDALWTALPLGFRTALFVDKVDGFGSYQKRTDAPFAPGATALIYVEPFGYGWAPDGDAFKSRLATDIEIRTRDGLIFGRAPGFAAMEKISRVKSRELNLSIALPLPASLKPGDYLLRLTMRDAVNSKSAETTLPFSIAK